MNAVSRRAATFELLIAAVASAGLLAACTSAAPATGPIAPGASGSPREVNIIAKDYSFLPDALDLVPGETVLLHVINGGLVVHEAVIGDASVQDAWEVATWTSPGSSTRPIVTSGPGTGRVPLVGSPCPGAVADRPSCRASGLGPTFNGLDDQGTTTRHERHGFLPKNRACAGVGRARAHAAGI